MKKLINIMLMALSIGGLALISGCEKGPVNQSGSDDTTAAHRGRVAGIYPVGVQTSTIGGIYHTGLTLSKEGENDLNISGSVNLPETGRVNIDLTLSSLKEYNDEGGQAVTGYFFTIAEQEVDVAGTPVTFSGTGKYDGFDGRVYKNADVAFISFEMSGNDGAITVEVESGAYVDHRSELVGNYPVRITSDILYIGTFPADFTVAIEGDSELRIQCSALGQFSNPGDATIDLDFVLSGLVPFDEEDGEPVEGYYFKIAEQMHDLPLMINFVPFAGTGKYDGHDGKIYKNAEGSFISFEVSGANVGGNVVTFLTETIVE